MPQSEKTYFALRFGFLPCVHQVVLIHLESIENPDPAPQQHIEDCFEIRNCRLGPCGLKIKSPNFSARGTAPPLRLLHGALVILVRLQISEFRSLGK